ncbi:MAG: hypothetical protein HY814_09430 [Candidatus Riflebacteria bacterium]|nr:hypothetical protein [Candidatus Riflebacteria bacterium]
MRRLATAILFCSLGLFLTGFQIFQISTGPKGTRNETCGDCHRALFREWRDSAHARSYTTPLFVQRSGNYSRKDCLPCHVPVTSQETPLTTRTWSQDTGVDCISCHVLRSVARGPYDVDSAHRSVQDERFKDERACQQCHAHTVRESREAPGKLAGQACQTCHMPGVKRHLAVGFYQVLRKRKTSTNHAFDLAALLRKAAELSFEYDAAVRELSVTVKNVGTPHMMPTGNHGAPSVRLVVYLESDEKGKAPIKRTMTFSNKDGTAIGHTGAGVLQIPLKSSVPVRYTAHARLLYLANDDVTEAAATVMAQKDHVVQYEPAPRDD